MYTADSVVLITDIHVSLPVPVYLYLYLYLYLCQGTNRYHWRLFNKIPDSK